MASRRRTSGSWRIDCASVTAAAIDRPAAGYHRAEPAEQVRHDLEHVEPEHRTGVAERGIRGLALHRLTAAVEHAARELAAQRDVIADRLLVAHREHSTDVGA